MHRVWIGVDSGILPRVECTCGVAQLSRMRVGTQSTWIFRPLGLFDRRHAQNIWSNSDQSYFVRCQDLGIRDLTPVSHKCTVSGLESIRAYCLVLSALAGWLNCQECEWGLSPLGSSGLSDFSTDATHKTFGLIPTSRTLSGVRTLAYGT